MRSKTVLINDKSITINEKKIKVLKNEILPKLEPAWQAIAGGDTSELIDKFGEQLQEVFPELKQVDFEECYPSEIEAFVEAWIEVNFTGLKRLVGPLMSLVKMGQHMPGFGSVSASASPTTGRN